MKAFIKKTIIITFVALFLVGCGAKDDNPGNISAYKEKPS